MPFARITGLLLAAGAGRRYGGPKALAAPQGEAWVVGAVRTLLDGGCTDVLVVTGAASELVEKEVSDAFGSDGSVTSTLCGTWEQGMGESLKAGLMTLASRGRTVPLAAVVHLVDLPDVGAEVVTRLMEEGGGRSSSLARAAYRGEPGHPVLIGQQHWQAVLGESRGDAGARSYLRRARPELVECGDLATGTDVDERA